MHGRTCVVAGCLVAGAIGYGLGALGARTPAPGASAPTSSAPACAPAIVRAAGAATPLDLAALLAEVRAAVRDELAATHAAEPEPAPQEVKALEDAGALVTAAEAAGRWGADEVRSFRALAAQMSPEQRDAAMSRLFTAINEDRLRLEVMSPL